MIATLRARLFSSVGGLVERVPFTKQRQRLTFRKAGGDREKPYFLYVPERLEANAPLVAVVHGIKRQPDEIARMFIPLAEQHGCILLAPLFSRAHYRDYQRLASCGKGKRPDHALEIMIEEVRALVPQAAEKLHMFGYSGGGQFVHRYVMTRPEQVVRAVIASPGWLTFPDITQSFPMGLRPTSTLPDLSFDLPKALCVPVSVMVGEHDTTRDPGLRKGAKIDHMQGINRIERGQRWVRQMSAVARAYNLDTAIEFQLLPNSGHSFAECMNIGGMGESVFRFLFSEQAPQLRSVND